MQKLQVAIFFDHNQEQSGNYQQSLNILLSLKKIISKEIDFKVISTSKKNIKIFKDLGFSSFFYHPNFFSRIFMWIRFISPFFLFKVFKFFRNENHFENFLKKKKIDLIYFVSLSEYVNYIEEINFIFTLFDLCHRDFPEFPEIRNFKNFEKREKLFQTNLPRAIAVIVESPLGKKNAIFRYRLNEERVHICRFSVTNQIKSIKKKTNEINIKKKFNLTFDYLFYPAQFWAHKNHIYILKALKILKENNLAKIGAIFCGKDQGNLNYIQMQVQEMGLHDRVKFIGRANSDEINDLYLQSFALVMPTYFGPTNLPPLEAFYLGVPVIYSDLDGLKDQVKDAALLIDLNDPKTLAASVQKLMISKNLRKDLIDKGKSRLKEIDNELNNVYKIEKIINNYKDIRSCWSQD